MIAGSSLSSSERQRLPDPDRVTDAAIIGFASWTVLSHAVTIAGGSLDDLLLAAALSVLTAAIGRPFLGRITGTTAAVEPDCPSAQAPDGASASIRTGRWLGLAAAAGFAIWVSAIAGIPRSVLWASATGVLVGGAGGAILQPAPTPPAAVEPRRGLIWGLALVLALVTLCANRPDWDDALYVNMAASAADHPDAPLLADDYMHGVDSLPIALPTYRVHSLETLAGALSRVTDVPAIAWFHLVFASFGAVLVVFAIGRVARLLAPGRWLWVTLATLAVLLLIGDVHAWYSNFAFVRLHQGKGIFVTALAPLILAYGIELARQPSRATWIRLAAVQVAAVGLTASALWIAPTVAVLAVIASSRPDRRSLTTIGAAVLSATYPIALAGGLWLGMTSPQNPLGRAIAGRLPVDRPAAAESEEPAETTREELDVRADEVAKGVDVVVGDGPLRLAVLALLLWGWWLSPEVAARRVHLVMASFFGAVLINPMLVPLLVRTVTGEPTFWRVCWVVPVPLLAGLFLTSPVARFEDRKGKLLAVALSIAVLGLVPSRPVFCVPLAAELGPPGLKVPPAYEVARALVELVPPDTPVVTPMTVSPWVVTFHHGPHPVVVRPHYFQVVSAVLGEKEARRRFSAFRAVSWPRTYEPRNRGLYEVLDSMPVTGVVVTIGAGNPEAVENALQDRGFVNRWEDDSYRVWVRTPTG
jgi:hypothetical protein